MSIVCVIQARLNSERLPGKVLLPLGDKFVLQQAVERIHRSKNVDQIIVATSIKKSDDLIAQLAPTFGAQVHRGSETDVLARLSTAARAADATRMVRITADCPFIDPVVIDAVVERAVSTDADYTSNTLERTFPRGSGVEVCKIKRMATVVDEATEPYQRDHVTHKIGSILNAKTTPRSQVPKSSPIMYIRVAPTAESPSMVPTATEWWAR